jgi:dTDP-4-amino-4,6-dideoxygalactose transaminase
MKNKIPFMDLRISNTFEKEILSNTFQRLMNHGQYIMGKEVDNFEKKFATYCHRKYCIGVSSGTDAIFIALRSLGIGPGDEVITTSLSWIATANAISMTGANPVFCDIDNDLNINIESLKKMISEKTKAILPVHYTGRACNIDAISEISTKYRIPVVYDAAQSFGSTYNQKPIGMYGDLSCFSMNPMKTLGALGEAGCIFTDDKELYEYIKVLRYNGTINKDLCVTKGLNGRLDSLQAAFLVDRLALLNDKIDKIKSICAHYNYLLNDIVSIPKLDSSISSSCYYSYTIQVENRDDLSKYLLKNGVETKVQHPILMCDQKPYLNSRSDKITNAREIVNKILCLPANEKITKSEVEYISNLIVKFQKNS